MTAEAAQLASLARKVRDADMLDSDRVEAALQLIAAHDVRSLTGLLVLVWGDDPHPSVAGFDIACESFRVSVEIASLPAPV